MRLVVTGGCGFIGSNFVRLLFEARPSWDLLILDSLTYAGNLQNIADLLESSRVAFLRGDIAEPEIVHEALGGADAVVNFAAESHVDRSIIDSTPFIRTNVVGTQVLLDASRELGLERFLQVSTDEVYGTLGPTGKFTEETPIQPNSPYSASKAGGDLLVRAAVETYGFPGLIVRSSNAYGPYQFPEKLIPLMVTQARQGKPLPVYGDGQQVRDWVHVQDLCTSILRVLEDGRDGSIYNVGGDNELPNIDVVRMIIELVGASPSQIQFVDDRPGHDRRYAMDFTRLQSELGWRPERAFLEGLGETVRWYESNGDWLESIRTGEYADYYEQQYGTRLRRADPV